MKKERDREDLGRGGAVVDMYANGSLRRVTSGMRVHDAALQIHRTQRLIAERAKVADPAGIGTFRLGCLKDGGISLSNIS